MSEGNVTGGVVHEVVFPERGSPRVGVLGRKRWRKGEKVYGNKAEKSLKKPEEEGSMTRTVAVL